ncbi:MAG TPA: hypothetical protein GX510_08260 [Firmicutes bacterium]|nr:hypothetical protein [Candidatus Fermentithermobacillaceae bacterium]
MRTGDFGEYVAFDLETTGLDPETNEILEIAMVRFRNGKPDEEWSSLVKPSQKVPLYVLRLTGIAEADLANAPVLEDILWRIREFIGNFPLVGHNSSFDIAFLGKIITDIGLRPCHDTLELSRIVVPGLASYKLSALCASFGIPLVTAHRALDDARASGILFGLLRERARWIHQRASSFIVTVMGDKWASRDVFGRVDARDAGQPAGESLVESLVGESCGGSSGTPGNPAGVGEKKETQLPDTGGETSSQGLVKAKSPELLPPEGITARLQTGPTLFSRPNVERAIYSALMEEPATDSGVKPAVSGEVWEKAILVQVPETADALAGMLAAAVKASCDMKDRVAVACLDGRTASKLERVLVASGGSPGAVAALLQSPRRRVCLARWRALETLVAGRAIGELDLETRQFLAMMANWLSSTKTGSPREIQMFGGGCQAFAELQASWYPGCFEGCAYSRYCFCLRQEGHDAPGVSIVYLEDLLSDDLPMRSPFAAVVVLGYHKVLDWCDRRADVLEPRQVAELIGATEGEVFVELDRRLGEALSRGERVLWFPGRIEMPPDIRRLLREGRDVLGEYTRRRSREDDDFKLRLSLSEIPGHLPILGRDISAAEKFLDSFERMLSEGPEKVLVVDGRYRSAGLVPVMKRLWVCPGQEIKNGLGTRARKVVLVSPFAQILAGKRGYEKLLAISETPRLITAGTYEEPAGILTVFVDGLPKTTDKEAFDQHCAWFIVELVQAVRTGCLVLNPFSSNAETLLEKIAQPLESRGILVVSADGPGKALEYLDQPDTVVLCRFFAFDEDDFSGAKCVIIPRLPFGVRRPEDWIRETEVRKAGGDYFRDITLTGILSRLSQVVDVLRSETGRRVLVVLDSRARPAGSSYGADVFKALTPGEHVVCPPLIAVNRIKSWLSSQVGEMVP